MVRGKFRSGISSVTGRQRGFLRGAWPSAAIAVAPLRTTEELFVSVVAALVILPLSILVRAWWSGAKPEVIDFGGDSAYSALSWLRKALHIKKRRTRQRRDD